MPRDRVTRSASPARGRALDRPDVTGRSSGAAVSGGGSGSVVVPPPSPTAPAISNIAVFLVSPTEVTVRWDLDQYATGQVEHGLTASYGSSTTAETSFDYAHHEQAITGLTANTTYHYRVRSTNTHGQETVSSDQTFTTEAAAAAFDDGMTYTDYSVPVGTTTLTGLSSWIAANVPDGASSTNHSRVLLGAGRTYSGTGKIDLTGRSHITFEGGGTESTYGHTGGARLSTTGGSGVNASVWYAKSVSSSASATDIRWHAMTVDGTYTNYRTTSAGANESQHGFALLGFNGATIDHCIMEKLEGDGAYLGDSLTGFNNTGYYSRDIAIRYSTVRYVGRMGVAIIWTGDVTVEFCRFTDICYSPFDIEPNQTWQGTASGSTVYFRNNLLDGDYWSWGSGYNDPVIAMGSPVAANVQGVVSITDNTITCTVYPGGTRETVSGEWGAMLKSGSLVFSRNVMSVARPVAALRVARWTGGVTAQDNTGFVSSGSWLTNSGSNGTITQSNNT